MKFLGVRGPQLVSVLEPKDCSKLVRIARDIEVRRRDGDLSMAHFRRGLRQEADFVPEEMFDALAAAFEDLQQLHRVLQLAWVKDWSGWDEIREKLGVCNHSSEKRSICEDAVKEFFECMHAGGCA